jgi:hypothetical protein
MKKKAIIIGAISLAATSVIAPAIYFVTRPKPVSGCDILLTKMLEAKTQDEHGFAEKRWVDTCITKGS